MRLYLSGAALLVLAATFCHAQIPEPDGGPIRSGTLPRVWQTGGPKCMEVPEWQIHEYNPDLYILRESGCTDFEKPFLFLFFGKRKALLLDTGSGKPNLGPTLDRTIHNWLTRNNRTSIPLLVVHTHEHEDHTAGDPEVLAMNDPAVPVTLVKADLASTKEFYHFKDWPNELTTIDLGDRVIDAIPIPGHTAAAMAFYDRQTAILFPGDSCYPGRLFVDDFSAFQASTERMIKFTDGKLVAHVIGNHIEERREAFSEYPFGTMYQPDEHTLELTRGDLLELEAGLLSMHGKIGRLAMPDFTIEGGMMLSKEAEKDFTTKMNARIKQQHEVMWDQTDIH